MQRFSSVVLVDDRGWVLLQERDEFPVIDPEKWGFVGGHLDEGEDYLAGAYRELEEETGIRLDGGLELFGEFPSSTRTPTPRTVPALRHAHPPADADIECHEGRQIVFVEPSLARELDLTASARIALPDVPRLRRRTPR